MKLWHFTCDHAHRCIGHRGMLRPNAHVMMPSLPPMVWLTDDPAPTRDAAGLTSRIIRCDRMAYRYRVEVPDAAVLRWRLLRSEVDPDVVADLEAFGRPSSWWVTFSEVPAVLA